MYFRTTHIFTFSHFLILSDPDTSDNEFVQKEAEEEEDSDVCSDLDEQEGEEEGEKEEEEEEERDARDQTEQDDSLGKDDKMAEEEELESEGESYFAEEESDGGCFSDNEEVLTFSRLKKKQKLFDSEEEEEEEEGKERKPTTCGATNFTSAAVETDKSLLAPLSTANRKMSVTIFGEEASMGPLVFSESFDPERTNASQPEERRSEGGEKRAAPSEQFVAEPREKLGVEKSSHSETLRGATFELAAVSERKPGEDSGVGGSLEDSEPVKEEEEEEEEEGNVTLTQALPDSDRDNSLESSLLWVQSLAPAQAWREEESGDTMAADGRKEDRTQWQATADDGSSIRRMTDLQNSSIDEQTQFLDANG